jgi:hypothetical protein
MHRTLGAAAWLALDRDRADRPPGDRRDGGRPVLRAEGATWAVSYAGREVHLPDLKGLHDLAALLGRPGDPVHVLQLLTGAPPGAAPGADPILDERARASYRRRLAQLDTEIDDADHRNDPARAERARLEREALLAELAAATGRHGRDRRLGDATERARKTVTSRIRDTIARIQRQHPELGRHLDAAVTTGIWCAYTPDTPR